MNMIESDFRNLLDTTHDPVVAVFSAGWCGPCRAFAPVFEAVSKQFTNKFAKLDVDEAVQLCEDLAISIVPTIIIFQDSKVAVRKEGGFYKESHFIDWLDSQGIKRK